MGHVGQGQLRGGSHGSWVTKDDPFPSLTAAIYIKIEIIESSYVDAGVSQQSKRLAAVALSLCLSVTLGNRHFGRTKFEPKCPDTYNRLTAGIRPVIAVMGRSLSMSEVPWHWVRAPEVSHACFGDRSGSATTSIVHEAKI